jgi:hypothetical protein
MIVAVRPEAAEPFGRGETMDTFFDVRGWWGKRPEDTGRIPQRTARYFAELASLHPLFGSWRREWLRRRATVPPLVTLPPDEAELRAWLDQSRAYPISRQRKLRVDHNLKAVTPTPEDERPFAHLWLRPTSVGTPGIQGNKTYLGVWTDEGDPSHLWHVARPMLMALISVWEPGWAGVATGDWGAQRNGPCAPAYLSGWMIYLDRHRARAIAEPEDLIVERLPDGAILLSATDEIFDQRDLAHRAAAHRLQEALAPLNDLYYATLLKAD